MGRVLCLGNYYHQVSETHQRLELDDIQESPESEQTERGKAAPAPALSQQIFISDLSAHGQAGAGIMKVRQSSSTPHVCFDSFYSQDWVLVAAGIERFCFFVYTMAFALVTSVYI